MLYQSIEVIKFDIDS